MDNSSLQQLTRAEDLAMGLIRWIASRRWWLGRVALGTTAYGVFNKGYDYVLYGWVISNYGALYGGLVMTVVTAILCIALIKIYDRSRTDWLGIEEAKRFRESGSGWAKRVAQKSDWLAFVTLSIIFDAVVTTLYMRKGSAEYNGLTRRDWCVFMGSTAVANAYWTGFVWMGLQILYFVVEYYKGLGLWV